MGSTRGVADKDDVCMAGTLLRCVMRESYPKADEDSVKPR
jgi:hypothetical protein